MTLWLRIDVVVLQASVFLLVFSLALRASFQEATSLFRRPGMLLRSLLAMFLVMPAFATLVNAAFQLKPAVKIALAVLAVSPVPPLLPVRQLKIGGAPAYVRGLLTATSLLAIVFIPVTMEVLGWIFGRNIHMAAMAVARIVFKSILLPLGLGMLVRWLSPGLAGKIERPLQNAANLCLLAAVLPLLLVTGRTMIGLVGQGTLLAIAAFSVTGMAVGHWLGGPEPRERISLALATASRHPSLALAIATTNFPEQRTLVVAALMLYLLITVLVLLAYGAWCKQRMATATRGTEAGPRQKAA